MQKVSSCGSRRARAGSIFGMRFSVWTYGEPNARRAANGSVLAETFTPRTELWVCNDGRTGHGDGRRVGWRRNAGQHVGGYARRARLYSRRACSACRAVRLWPSRQASPCQVGWSHTQEGAPILSARIGRDLTHARRHYDRRRRTRADSASRDASNRSRVTPRADQLRPYRRRTRRRDRRWAGEVARHRFNYGRRCSD